VLFLTLGDLRPGLSVAGSFNGWAAGQDLFLPLGGGQVGYVGRQVGGNARHAYKLTDGASWFRDPKALEIEWDGFNPGTIGEFNSVFFTQGAIPSGRLRLLRAHSNVLSNDREVYVFLPPGYDENPQARYPTLYFHDGNESIVRSQMDQVVRDEILAGQVAPLIAVFVALPSQNVRFAEYTFGTPGSLGDSYESFIADELVPLIDQKFRTLATPEARGIIGASLGGLISFHIGYERDDVFRRVGGQSSSFFWNNSEIVNRLATGPKKALRVYLDAGNVDGSCGGGDNCDVTRQMKAVLDSRGYTSLHVEQLFATHDWAFWNERLPGALRFLFPPSDF
jgi:iron(III)-enterobactin esterase